MKVEEIEKWHQENPDRLWEDIHIRTLLSRIHELKKCLQHGVNRGIFDERWMNKAKKLLEEDK